MRHIHDDERRARLGVRHALAAPVADTLGVVLKHASDQERAVKELRLPR